MPFDPRPVALILGCILATAACSDPAPEPPPAPSPVAPPAPTPTQADVPVVDAPPAVAAASSSPQAQAIDAAVFDPAVTDPEAIKKAMLRAQVLLDRAHMSPGVIDGRPGTNVTLALEAFQAAKGLPVNGKLDKVSWDALVAGDDGPVMTDYAITAEDVAGPFQPNIPKDDYEAMSKLPTLAFGDVVEALAERFHMDEALLRALNPGADFAVAGTSIVIAAVGTDKLAGKVARIEIDKARGQVRAFDDKSVQLAVYPATVGSTERPAPTGEWAVNTVAPRPTYTYDPSRLTFGKPKGKLTIKAGPNNPVGSTWIDLTKDTYGIHGTPDPKLVNKRASHGCVRLTNWDAAELGAAVQKGAKVVFLGAEARKT
ncbi:L,D-transpeptidase family protein [Caulobacter sp. DWR1-3-2b1]|uniref:L,D-transpeptidase family protein n=1 Tax=Caulobacter sp. DWR1-3-2b1 TaxID=2804670 RepID=UPI003CE997AD